MELKSVSEHTAGQRKTRPAELELRNRKIARRTAAEGIVLLKMKACCLLKRKEGRFIWRRRRGDNQRRNRVQEMWNARETVSIYPGALWMRESPYQQGLAGGICRDLPAGQRGLERRNTFGSGQTGEGQVL